MHPTVGSEERRKDRVQVLVSIVGQRHHVSRAIHEHVVALTLAVIWVGEYVRS